MAVVAQIVIVQLKGFFSWTVGVISSDTYHLVEKQKIRLLYDRRYSRINADKHFLSF